MSGSTVSDALAGLTATWTGVVSGLQVSDGPFYDPGVNFLAVGWPGANTGIPGVVAERAQADAGRARDSEDFDIACVLAFHVGDASQVATLRGQMFAALDLLDAALKANSQLGVTGVGRADLGTYALEQSINETGSYLLLRLTVHVTAWK